MNGLIDGILSVPAVWVYVVVGLLVFVEDALFVGFVVPGEAAAVVGGVTVSLGHTDLWPMIALVVAAAIVGDSVGYELGKHIVGPKLLEHPRMSKLKPRIDKARAYLQRKGGMAVFLARFTAFFRAVMPALAGASRMPYATFVRYNALGGLAWGAGFVLVGYLAGHSYKVVEKEVGRGLAIGVAAIALVALIGWHITKRRRVGRPTDDQASPSAPLD